VETKLVLNARQWTGIIVYGMLREVRFPLRVSHTYNTEAQYRFVLPIQYRHRNAFRHLWPTSGNISLVPYNVYSKTVSFYALCCFKLLKQLNNINGKLQKYVTPYQCSIDTFL
jgi:hypothetical protein